MAIAQLEHAVGTNLFVRNQSRRLFPTAAGIELATRARTILGLVDELEGAVAGTWSEMRGDLRLGCMTTLSPRMIPGLVDHFSKVFPEVNLTFREGAAAELQQDVVEGRLDAAFVYSLQATEPAEHVKIAGVRLHLMLPDHHRLADRTSLSLHDVADETAILFDVPPTIERVVGMMRSVGVEPNLRWQSTNMETIRSLVARGLGFSVANSQPESNTTFDNRKVKYVPLSDDLPGNTIVCALPPKVRPPKKVEEAISYCQATASRRGLT